MDILTPAGQRSLTEEARAVELFERRFPSSRYIHTPKNKPASIDGLILNGGQVVAVVETKCRQMTRTQLIERGNTWLVTFDKLERARAIAAGLSVPLFGLLYLVPEDTLLLLRIADERGEYAVQFSKKRSITQATVNGGMANRVNAYLDLSKAIEINA